MHKQVMENCIEMLNSRYVWRGGPERFVWNQFVPHIFASRVPFHSFDQHVHMLMEIYITDFQRVSTE